MNRKSLPDLEPRDTSTMKERDVFAYYKRTAPLEDLRFFLRAQPIFAKRLGGTLEMLERDILEGLNRPEALRRLCRIQDEWRSEAVTWEYAHGISQQPIVPVKLFRETERAGWLTGPQPAEAVKSEPPEATEAGPESKATTIEPLVEVPGAIEAPPVEACAAPVGELANVAQPLEDHYVIQALRAKLRWTPRPVAPPAPIPQSPQAGAPVVVATTPKPQLARKRPVGARSSNGWDDPDIRARRSAAIRAAAAARRARAA